MHMYILCYMQWHTNTQNIYKYLFYILCYSFVYTCKLVFLIALQVFLYDGTQSCSAASFLPFFVIGIGVIVLFVIPVPFVLCVLTTKRWQVSTTI